jgi:two-component system chemotaxis response regulator CheB
VVVVGASAGGISALPQLVRQLPADLPAAVFVVQHLYAEFPTTLPGLLEKAGVFPARHPADGERIEPGTIYVAPPDYHLLLRHPDTIELSHGARENLHRPAIDPLFRSAARLYGSRAIGVLLTGTKDDGSAGLLAIKMRGGVAIVQDPTDAAFGEMPQSALEQVDDIDYVAPLDEIPGIIVQVARQLVGVAKQGPCEEQMANESEPRTLICPECGGALEPHEQGQLLQFHCHVGHVFGPETLRVAYGEQLENTLWAALRAFREQVMLLRQLSLRASNARLREEYLKQADAGEQHAQIIRELLQQLGTPSVPGKA